MTDSGPISRRSALVRGIAATAAVVVPSLAQGETPAPARVVARRRIAGPRLVVIGAGAFGGWTALALQRAGAQVTLLDAWGAGHSRASSGDETRVIRAMYNGNATYTAMVQRAFALWTEAEARWQRPVLTRTGALYLFEGDDAFATQSMPIMRERGIAVEPLAIAEARRRWPQIRFDGIRTAYWESGAGFLAARASCELVREEFVRAGGTWEIARVAPPAMRAGRLDAITLADGRRLAADGFVFACGPWMGALFPEAIGTGIAATRQEVVYFGTPAGDTRYDASAFPVWVHFGARRMYGIPGNDRRGFKVADDTSGAVVDPTTMDRIVRPQTITTARALLARRFPGLVGAPVLESRVCQYEFSPLGDFLLDRHPDATNVWLAGGGSGHGFKMGPALGEQLARQVLDETAPEPIFSYRRFAEERAKLTGARRQHS
jgi:glycine/D-amino acid oxidase-like deaminating enzyme